MFKYNNINLAIPTVIGLGCLSLFFFWSRRRSRFVFVGTIKKLFIYPVKSLPAIEVDSLELTKSGVKHGTHCDRSFVLVNKNHNMITMRNHQKLGLLRQEMHGDQLWILASDQPVLKLDPEQISKNGAKVQTKVWQNAMEGIDCGDEAASWFETYLSDAGVRLLYHAEGLDLVPSREQIGDNHVIFTDNKVRYQDEAATVHLINDNSVKDLDNRVAGMDVDFRRFRPSFLVEAEAYDEDFWKYTKIANCMLKRLRFCTRCIMTTIDPETTEKTKEPLETLKTYRKSTYTSAYGAHPLFGTNLAVLVEGTVSVGDEIHAQKIYERHVQN